MSAWLVGPVALVGVVVLERLGTEADWFAGQGLDR